jgi:hypothetical protein
VKYLQNWILARRFKYSSAGDKFYCKNGDKIIVVMMDFPEEQGGGKVLCLMPV